MARISLIDHDDLPPDDRDLLDVLSDPDAVPDEYRHLISSPTRNVFRTIGHLPAVLRAFRDLGGALWEETDLTTRQRELIILALAREHDSRYVWHQHVRIALSNGLTKEELERLSTSDRDDFPEEERLLIRYALAFSAGEVDDPLHAEAAEVFEERTLVGVGMIAGYYLTIFRLMDGLDVETEEHFVGWELERLVDPTADL